MLFFEKNPKGILTRDNLAFCEGESDDVMSASDHAVVVDPHGSKRNYLAVKNSWGTNWADHGSFRIENIKTLSMHTAHPPQLHELTCAESDTTTQRAEKGKPVPGAKEVPLVPFMSIDCDYSHSARLGHGAHGTVYACNFENEPRAVKVVAKGQDRRYAFQHNIIKVIGHCEYPLGAEAMYCIVMKRGVSLTPERYNALHPHTHLELVECLAAAVLFISDLGVAHRDIKPENIICVDGVYKLCDFGTASNCPTGKDPTGRDMWVDRF